MLIKITRMVEKFFREDHLPTYTAHYETSSSQHVMIIVLTEHFPTTRTL